MRKADGLRPGPTLAVDTDADYRGRRHRLRMQAVLQPSDRVLMVDDWAEHGSQALAARRLVEFAARLSSEYRCLWISSPKRPIPRWER
ncbi:MAG TPA: hypothetical protein VHI14_01760 [Jatrophihabitantaceae bacterium]|nr:hypothetical protein [Jatrophihabitantaceae bacterium]